MSTVVRPQTRVKAQGKAEVRVGLWDLVRAELTRSRRTFTWGVIGATLIFTVHTIILANASVSSGVVKEVQWNGNALAWMHMYAGAFAVPLGLLTGAMAQWREQRWRQGGTAWRAVAPRRVAAARIVVLSLSALACQVALVAPVVGHALIVGNGWGPWDRYLLFATYMSPGPAPGAWQPSTCCELSPSGSPLFWASSGPWWAWPRPSGATGGCSRGPGRRESRCPCWACTATPSCSRRAHRCGDTRSCPGSC